MLKFFTKNWRTILVSTMLSLTFSVFSSTLVIAQAPPPSNSSTTPTGTVTQPPIIPAGSIPSGSKLYLPHDTANVGNKNYIQNSLLPGIASTIIGLTGGLSLVFVVISGIQYLTAYGDGGAADKAKKTLTWALIGVVVAGLSYAIVAIISTINVNTVS